MTGKADTSNLALSHLGVGKKIADFENERSQEAAVCRDFYDLSLDATLKAYSWPFATKFISLSLVEENPNSEWKYAYRYPNDCAKFRRILSGQRIDTRDSRIPFRQGSDSTGTLIYTDKEEAEGEYTVRVSNPVFYPADFVLAHSYYLASLIAPRVTGGDPFKLTDKSLQLFKLAISQAESNAASEEVPDLEPDSEFLRTR